jgi:hypothetical protein
MTARLEQVLRSLSSQDLERVTKFAESLAQGKAVTETHLRLDWAGAAAAYPEIESGVDAAHAAMGLMRQAMNQGLRQ